MRIILSGLMVVIASGCDAEYAASELDDADGGDVAPYGGGGLGGLGAFGADPESGVSVAGRPSYTPADPGMVDGVVVMGGARGPSGVRVIAPLGTWEGGPVVASEDKDAQAVAVATVGREPLVDRTAETGSWLVIGGRVVIAEGPTVDASWAAREPSDERRPATAGHAFVVRSPVALARLPEEVLRVIGSEVRVFDGEREVCIARVAALSLEARLVHEPLGPWDPAYSEREVLTRGLRSVVATLEPFAGGDGACQRGVVAVGVRAPSPELFAEVDVAPSLRRKAIAAMCALPAWQAMAREDDGGPLTLWSNECRLLSVAAEVRRYVTRSGKAFVLVSSDGVHAGFHVRAGALDNAWAHLGETPAEGLIDVQGDGTPELVLASTDRAPSSVVGLSFAGDLSEPTFLEDFTPVPPRRLAVGGFGVPDYSVFRAR